MNRYKCWAIGLGVLVTLIFSIPPLNSINVVFCAGVTGGALIAAYWYGKKQGNQLDSVEGLLIGFYVGELSAILLIGINMISSLVKAGICLDPIPPFIYIIAEAFWDGFRGIALGGAPAFDFDLRFWEKSLILLLSNAFFGAFGGIWGATLFEEEPALYAQVSDES